MTADTVAPARWALICHHNPTMGPASIETTRWDTRAQAEQASAELAPCGPRCCGAHTVVCVDAPARGQWHPAGRCRDPHRTNKTEAKR
jgi:hypothetical protein